MSAAGFLSTLGIDTHMAYTDGDYANVTQVIADLKYLGIDQVRDGITNSVDANGNYNGSAPISTYLAMARAGIKFTFIIEATSNSVIAAQLALINQVETAVPGSVLAIEGPNEVNNQPVTFNGLTGQQGAMAAQQALYAAVKADATLAGVPVDYFTGYDTGSTDPTATPGLADFDNQHPYPNFDQAPAFWVSRAQALTNLSSSDVATAPAVYTETGYSTGAVDAVTQEEYTLDLLMDTAKDGISQTYLYDLLDAYAPGSPQGNDGFGLFDSTGAAKPAAGAIHNLTELLQSTNATAAVNSTSLTYTISGLPSTGNSLLLEKSDGTYVLAVWAEPQIYNNSTNQDIAAPSQNVTVTLPQYFGSIQVFDPTSGTSAIANYRNSNSATITVTDHPILIELGSAAETIMGPVLTIAAPQQVANTTEVTLSGTVTDAAQASVQVVDGSTVLGAATVSNGSWSFTSANLAAGNHSFSAIVMDTAGNTATASDAAFSIVTPPLTIVYNTGIDTSTTTRTVSDMTPETIGGTGSDMIVLAIAEDAYLGDAQFTVSVDGTQIGGVQTATVLHSAGQSQSFTLQGNFGAGAHIVSVDFLNDAAAIYSNGALAGDRNLYVDAITGDGVTTVENVEQNLAGTTNYQISLPAVAAPPPVAPPVIVSTGPALTIAAPVQVANTTEVTLSGTVTDATQTSVQVLDGSTVLGVATVSNGSWSFTSANLTAGSHSFSAIATDMAGNTATASDAAFSISAPATTADPQYLLATVSTGTGTAQQEVQVGSATPIKGTYVPISTSGIGTNPLVLYNWNPATQLQSFLSAQAAGTASIIGIGDSTTSGFGASTDGWTQLSYISEMAQALTQDGVAAQTDNFLGSEFFISNAEDDDDRLNPVGYTSASPYYDGGFSIVAGGNLIHLASAGKGFDFQLETPGNYNRVMLSYVDLGSGSVSLTVDGVTVGSMTFGNTGQTLTQTLTIPAGMHSDLMVESTSANPVYIQGASFSSTTTPAIQVYNAGIGGWDSGNADSSVVNGQLVMGSANGYGQTASSAALKPSLAFINLGTNDIALSEDTTAQTLANIEQMVATLQAAGTDVIIVIPQPFGSSNYATELPALRAGLEAYSTANNVPLIDLSATYDNSEAMLEAAGLKSDLLHPNATLYADIGSQLANLLTTAINNAGAPVGQTYIMTTAPMTITGTAGNDTITATSATLNALDKIDGGGGTNTLVLSGGGSFDLRSLAALTNIQVVSAAEAQVSLSGSTAAEQTVHLRNGLNVTVNVVSGTPAAGDPNQEAITIDGAADSSVINLGTGRDVINLGSASETVNAAKTGFARVQGSAAMAGALINGNGQSTTSLAIFGSGGTAVLNPGDTELTIVLEGATNLTLSPMQFITADGSLGGSTITALASNQTLLGGVGDTLNGAAAFGDLFKGTSALMNHDIISNFGGSDQIDLTDILATKVTGLSWTANSNGGVLSITDGTHSAALSLKGNYTASSFGFKTDGASGTVITYI